MNEMGRSYNTHHATAKAGETSSWGDSVTATTAHF